MSYNNTKNHVGIDLCGFYFDPSNLYQRGVSAFFLSLFVLVGVATKQLRSITRIITLRIQQSMGITKMGADDHSG